MLFNDLVSHNPVGDRKTVEIVPFEGVAPEMFPIVFRMGSRRRLPDGTFEAWTPSPPTSRKQANVPALADEEKAVADFAGTSSVRRGSAKASRRGNQPHGCQTLTLHWYYGSNRACSPRGPLDRRHSNDGRTP
jgi:hypothetical protein